MKSSEALVSDEIGQNDNLPLVLIVDVPNSTQAKDLETLPIAIKNIHDNQQLNKSIQDHARRPSLILVNSHSKSLDPFKLLKELKQSELTKAIPVILFCDCVNECPDDKTEAFSLGCDDFISLPIDPREFRARVQAKVRSALHHQKALEMAYKDDLSGLVNRRGYNCALINEWARCKRTKMTISMLIIDIDNFKELNDKFGHAKGDELLMLASQTLKKAHKRDSDIIARYGGDEFIFLLPDCTCDGAAKIANELVEHFNQLPISHNHLLKMSQFSISIGVSSLMPNDKNSASELFALADNALYQAKREGKNCWKRAQ